MTPLPFSGAGRARARVRSVLLSALVLLCANVAAAQELLVLPGSPPGTQVYSVPAMDSPAVQPLGVSPRSLVPRAALPTRDGTDLIILGCQGGFGDASCASTGAASVTRLSREAIGFTEILGGSLPNASSVVTHLSADWVGTSNRHLVVLAPVQTGTGIETVLRFYDSAAFDSNGQLTPAVPTGWSAGTSLALPAGFNAQTVVALSPTQLLLSDGTATLRLVSSAGTFTSCAIDGGSASLAVKSVLALPNRGAIIALRQTSEAGELSGKVAVMPPDCSGGASTSGNDYSQPFADILALAQDGARVYGSGVDPLTGATFLVTWNLPGAGTSLSGQALEIYPAPADPALVGEPYGALAVQQSGGVPYLVIAGAGGGFRIRKFVGGAFPLVTPTLPGGVSSGPAAAAVLNPASRFTLSSRLVDLNPSLSSTNSALVEVFGANGKGFTIFPGSCRQTDVADAVETANGIAIRGGQGCSGNSECPLTQSCVGQTCRLPLSSRTGMPGSFVVPGGGPTGGRTLLAFLQPGSGENCELVIACDPTSAGCTTASGGGAIVKVLGGARSLALVLDRSGSMTLPVAPGDPTTRQAALLDALTVFKDVVTTVIAGIGDNQRYVVVPFDNKSLGYALPMGAPSWTGTEFITPANQSAITALLTPSGATNIRGALRTAADRLAAIPAPAGGAISRSVLLMTDGLHNTRGLTSENDNNTTSDATANLLNIVSDLKASGPDGRARVNRLYAVGLSPASYHPSLLDLVRQVNSSASSGALPPGYLNYADAHGGTSGTTQLTQFFTKVLWDYLGATEFIDPVFTLPTAGSTRTIDVDMRSAQSLVVVVAWRGASPPAISLGVDGKVQSVLMRSCRSSARDLVCIFAPAVLNSGSALNVIVARSAAAGDPGEILVEAAGASRVRLLPLQTRPVVRTGELLPFLVRATEDGLPLRKSPALAATLIRPKAALGTILANAQIGADAIKRQLSATPDETPASAKLSLLKAGELPGYEEIAVRLLDDGKSGDGAAGDGIFGFALTADVPGLYQLVVSGSVAGGSGAVRRETSLATQVVVSVSGERSITKKVYTPGDKERRGALELELRPQDVRGNLLGPGTGEIFRFRQGGRLLPSTVTEPDTYDGSYRVAVTGIVSPGPAVIMEGVGLSEALVLVPDYRPPAAPGPTCQGGCCCDVAVARPASPLWAGVVATVLCLALLLRARRRRDA